MFLKVCISLLGKLISLVGTVTQYHQLGGLNDRNVFSQVWKPKVQDPGVSRADFSGDLSPLQQTADVTTSPRCLSAVLLNAPAESLSKFPLIRTPVRLV